MINSQEIKIGTCIRMDGKIWTCIDFQHRKPGKGNTVMITKLKNVSDGRVLERTFQIGFKLDVTCPVDVGIGVLLIHIAITSRTDAPDGKGPDAVGSTDIELLVVGRGTGVAVTVNGTCHHPAYQMGLLAHGPIIAGLQGSLDELGKGIAHPVLALFTEGLARQGIEAVKQKTRL